MHAGGKVCYGKDGLEVCGEIGAGTPGYGFTFDPFGQPSNPKGEWSAGLFGEVSVPGYTYGWEAMHNPSKGKTYEL